MPETIKMGALTLDFLQSKDETGGSLDLKEIMLRHGLVPLPPA